MHLWKKRLIDIGFVAILAGCDALRHQAPGTLIVRAAEIVVAADGAQLEVDLDCRLNGPISDALEHGIPITLRVDLFAHTQPQRLRDRRDIELRYFPLTRRYQVHDLASGNVRSFSTLGSMVDSLGALRVPIPQAFGGLADGTRVRVDVGLDHAALPGPLRLPALLEPAWQLVAAEYSWIVTAG